MPRAKSSPKDPFAAKEKQNARIEVWSEFSFFKSPRVSKVLLLPGTERYELDVVALKMYDMNNVFLVDKSAAVIATLTRRSVGKSYPPRENRCCMLVSQAAQYLVKRGVKLDCAHLDYCGNVDSSLIEETRVFINSRVMANDSLLAITWLSGREHDISPLIGSGALLGANGNGHTTDTINSMSPQDRGRLKKVHDQISGYDVSVRKVGRYYNDRTYNPMTYVILHLRPYTPPTLNPNTSPVDVFRSSTRKWHIMPMSTSNWNHRTAYKDKFDKLAR